jgi:hypothetical protein
MASICHDINNFCDECFELQFEELNDFSITPTSLVEGSVYYLHLFDKFNNHYVNQVQIGANGAIPFYQLNYPTKLFNRFAGVLYAYLSTSQTMGDLDVDVEIDEVTLTCFNIKFTTCIEPPTPPVEPPVCLPATLLLNGGVFTSVASGATTDIELVDEDGATVNPISVVGTVITLPESGGGGDVIIENSDASFTDTATCGSTFIIPDEDYEVYVDSVLVDSGSFPTLGNAVINIDL